MSGLPRVVPVAECFGALPREQLRGLGLAGCTSPRKTSRRFADLTNTVMVTAMRLFVDEPRVVGRALAIAGGAGFAAAAAGAGIHHFENPPRGVSMRRSADFAGLVNRLVAQMRGAAPQR